VAAPISAHVAAPLPLDVVRDPDVGAVAAVAHITDTGVVMDADPNPVTTDVTTDEHVSLFLRHARRCAEATGLTVDIAPPDTSTGIVIGPTPGVATPVVVVGPTTDGGFSTADGALPYGDDFAPIIAGSDRDEVTAVAPDGADLEPTSPDLTSTRGGDTTAAMPAGTGQVADDVPEGGFSTDDFADEVLSDDDAVDFDPHSAWGGDGEVTTALPRINGADLEPTSPDLASARDSDTAAAMPAGTGRVVDDVSDGGFGTDYFADEVLSDDGDDATAAMPCMDIGAVATSSVTATRKRTRRSKHSHVVRDERKRQRRAALPPTTQGDTEAGT